jgi:hypothetical protein
MDTNEIEIKEVYALCGAAAYFTQCFERQLAIAVSTVCITDPDMVTREQYDALLSRNFSRTLGQLFHLMKSDITISDEIKDSIAEALRDIQKINPPIHKRVPASRGSLSA